jgi:hypothetical protein
MPGEQKLTETAGTSGVSLLVNKIVLLRTISNSFTASLFTVCQLCYCEERSCDVIFACIQTTFVRDNF